MLAVSTTARCCTATCDVPEVPPQRTLAIGDARVLRSLVWDGSEKDAILTSCARFAEVHALNNGTASFMRRKLSMSYSMLSQRLSET